MADSMFPAVGDDHDRVPGAGRAKPRAGDPGTRRKQNPVYSPDTANVRLAPAILDVIPSRIAPPHRVSLPIHDKIPVHE